MEAVRALSKLPDVKLPTAKSAYPDQRQFSSIIEKKKELKTLA